MTAEPELRSSAWYAGDDRNSYLHRAWMRRGLPDSAFTGRPQIAIANTASDLTPCNAHLNEIADFVKRGVWEAGGVPHNLPVVSLGETQVRPTAMLWRNLAAMAIEEMLRANPIDGVVLLGGCDKTIPALLMAAASVDLPAIVVPGGPMLNGTFRGESLGCGTGVWRLSEEVRAGTLSPQAFRDSESSMIRSAGHCNTMGTASTMGLLAEALGTTLPGSAGIPAPDSRLRSNAHEAGRLIVEMIADGRRPSQVMTAGSFRNAIVARLRHSIAVGRTCVSPRETTGRLCGTPPASQTPRFTKSAISLRCALQGVRSEAVLAIAMCGRPVNASSVRPRRIHARCR